MAILIGLLLNVVLWAAAAALFTAWVVWALAFWFPGRAAGESPGRGKRTGGPKSAGDEAVGAEEPRKAA